MPFHNRIAARLLVLLVLAGLTACGSNRTEPVQIELSTPVPTLTPPPKTALPFTREQQTNWLAGKPCAPSCWEGITPGKTRLSEALAILNWHPQIRDIDVYRSSFNGEVDVRWRWNGSTDAAGELRFWQIEPEERDDPFVTRIVAPSSASFSLQTLIDAYGEPSYILPSVGQTMGIPDGGGGGGRPYYWFTIVYHDRGFYVSTRTSYDVPPRLSMNMSLESEVVFFDPTVAQWGSTGGAPWQGEQEFLTYCRQVKSYDYHPVCPDR
jgi:hypothetical protein